MASKPADTSPGPVGPGDTPDVEEFEELVVDAVFAHSRLWAHLVLLGLLTVGVLFAFQEMAAYPERARQFPEITFYAMLGMIAVRAGHLVVVARRDGQPRPDRGRLRREGVVVAWLAGLAAATVLLGVIPGSIAFLAAYLLVHRPVKRWVAAVVVVVTWLAVQGLFVNLLNLPFRPGLLLR